MKTKSLIIAAIAIILAAASCEQQEVAVPVTNVELTTATLNLIVGENSLLDVIVTPENATDTSLVWSTSDESVAKVDGGLVTAVGVGKAEITVVSGDCSAKCDVTVQNYPEIGDLFYSDGTWSKTYDASKNVIGIVFQTFRNDNTRFGEAEKDALAQKGIAEPKGLVVSCRMAGSSLRWSDKTEDVQGISNCITCNENYMDISGLHNTNAIRNIDSEMTGYPAFKKAAIDFDKIVQSPENTTGWFLPSAGQCWDILQYLAQMPCLSDKKTQSSEEAAPMLWGDQGNMIQRLNDAMAAVPADQKDEYGDQIWFWSSTEYSDTQAMDWDITSFGFLSSNFLPKTLGGSGQVRAVLAF